MVKGLSPKMGADDGELDQRFQGAWHGLGQRTDKLIGAPHDSAGQPVEPARKPKEGLVREGRPGQGDAERQAPPVKAGGHGNTAQIEEVGEARVVAEVAVEPDGVGLDRLDGVGGPGRGERKAIHERPLRPGLALECLEPVEARECLGCAIP